MSVGLPERTALINDAKPNGAQTPVLIVAELPAGFVRLLTESPDFAVLQCQEEPSEVLSDSRRMAPCVLLAREQFVLSAGQNFLSELIGDGHSNKLLVICSSEANLIPELLHLGCSGALRIDMPPTDLHRAIRAVASGELWFPRKVMSNAIRTLLSPGAKRLTAREREILKLIALGYNNREIAQALFISRETVRWHVRSLYTKIGTHDRKRVIAIAAEEWFTP